MRDRITIKVTGIDRVNEQLNEKLKRVGAYTPRAFTDIVLDCLGKSVERAPVDTGDLRGSGRAEIMGRVVATGREDGGINRTGSTPTGYKLEGVVLYDSPYALRQHEELGYHHPQGGQAKFLESVVKENTDRWVQHIASSVKKAFK